MLRLVNYISSIIYFLPWRFKIETISELANDGV